MGKELAYLICGVIVLFKVFKTCITVVKRDKINWVVQDIISDIALLLTFFIYLNFSVEIASFNYNIINRLIGSGQGDSILVRLVVEIVIFFIIRWALDMVLSFIQNLLFRDGFDEIGKSKAMSMVTGVFIGFLKGFITLIGVFIVVTIINTFIPNGFRVSVFDDVKAYRKIENFLNSTGAIKNYPSLISKESNKGVIYYNGIRIEDGIKSNDSINKKARELTKNSNNDRQKAKILYSYVGAHIQYDYDKAERVSSSDFSSRSGAVEAFNTGSGICLDYACLYTAMANAVDLKVRVVVGEMNDRGDWIGHAWNEVYLEDEGKWIQVDPTNYTAGNYFDNKKVELNYKTEDIAYEN
ncbi:MAG: transglutaminase-like domain-containing protein [Clostridium sp.]